MSSAIGLDDKLFVCGDFTKAGSKPANSVALWDAGGWKALAQSIQVKSYQSLNLAVDSAKGVLLAGEGLELIDSLVLNGIARWNGTSWSKLLPSVYKADITRMCVAEDGTLFCAGSVDSSDKRIVRALARWTGTYWDDLGVRPSKFIPSIGSLACKGELLYVCGQFDSMSTHAVRNVAVWNMRTREWSGLGDGLYNSVIDSSMRRSLGTGSIAFLGDTVYFSGDFCYAGSKPSYGMAAWLPAKTNVVEQESERKYTAVSVYPNPTQARATLRFGVETEQDVLIQVVDLLGTRLQTVHRGLLQAGSYSSSIDLGDYSVGLYYVLIQRGLDRVAMPLHLSR